MPAGRRWLESSARSEVAFFRACCVPLFACVRQKVRSHGIRPGFQPFTIEGVPDDHYIILSQPGSLEQVAKAQFEGSFSINSLRFIGPIKPGHTPKLTDRLRQLDAR